MLLKEGGAGWECTAPTSLLSVPNPGIPALLPSACSGEIQRPHADLAHGIRRSTWIHSTLPWNYEFHTFKPFIFCCLLILLYETLHKLFPARAEAELFESGKLVFFTISHPKTLMLSIPSPTTEMRAFGKVNSKEKERKWKGSEKHWYVGEKLEVEGDEVIVRIENIEDYLA